MFTFIKKFLKLCLSNKGYVCLVKENPNIKCKSALLSAVMLAILLLIAPCKVRNHIEDALGIKQTEVSNKSNTTKSNVSCQTLQVSQTAKFSSKLTNLFSSAIISLKVNDTPYAIGYAVKAIPSLLTESHSHPFIALYILYQNFKIAL